MKLPKDGYSMRYDGFEIANYSYQKQWEGKDYCVFAHDTFNQEAYESLVELMGEP